MIWEYIWQQKTKIINNKKVFAEGGGGGGGDRLKIQDKFGKEGSENFYYS